MRTGQVVHTRGGGGDLPTAHFGMNSSLAISGVTLVPWDVTDWDYIGVDVTDPTQPVIPSDGTYLINAFVEFGDAAGGYQGTVFIQTVGDMWTEATVAQGGAAVNGFVMPVSATDIQQFRAGDQVTIAVTQTGDQVNPHINQAALSLVKLSSDTYYES